MQLNDFINKVWDAKYVDGCIVVDKRVTYGSEPDIEFTVKDEDGEFNFISAKNMFWKQMAEISDMQDAAEKGVKLW